MSDVPKIPLADESERQRFIDGLDCNFGVIAPAGVGKTHSIVSRIAALANHPDGLRLLPTLVVVTYTKRAAQEMQRRARARILEQASSPELLGAFNRAFFGTIHSFCLRLLQSYGHTLGVPGRAQLLEDSTELWERFVRQSEVIEPLLAAPGMDILLRHMPVTDVFNLARDLDPRVSAPEVVEPCPPVYAGEVLSFTPERKNSLRKISQDQAALGRWLESLKRGGDFLPLLQPTSESAAFVELWESAMAPRRRWLGRMMLLAASRLAQAYQRYRATSGFLTFQDQITLAAALFDNESVARSIRRENYRIILDEAQDTDPEQFRVLFEAAKDADYPGELPPAGRFAMVGDRQQSIYGARADLSEYQRLHDELTQASTGGESRFTVTFRCAQRVIDFVNGAFPAIFPGTGGQVNFVPLSARSQVTPGQVVRLPVEKRLPEGADPEAKLNEAQRMAIAAKQVATFIHEQGLRGLRAREWGQVAILCPYKRWFGPLVRELKAVGLACQLHSMREIAGDSPAYAWFCALIWIMAHPRDGYEIVGVLREVFGISDHELATFADGREGVFQIVEPTPGSHPVAKQLDQLAALRRRMLPLPLRDAVRAVTEGVQLRERLRALPLDGAEEELERELDDLLVYASMLEVEDSWLGDLAQRLKDGFEQSRESQSVRHDALQLMTCHKAKGLEWDAVVVPFLFRKLRGANATYPRVWKSTSQAEPTVLLGGEDLDDEAKYASRMAGAQEWERVLYVTCTRARETLVLADDRALFDEKQRDYEALSLGNLLVRADEANLDLWRQLPTQASVMPSSADRTQARSIIAQQSELDFSSGAADVALKIDVDLARQHAGDFPRRLTPHALAVHFTAEEPEARAERDEDRPEFDSQTPATIYGTWWHGLMESLPWTQPRTTWSECFEQRVAGSIDPERSRHEWELFVRSSLATQLNRADGVFQPEMPFLWRESAGQVIEGVMDLAVYDPQKDEWLVVDWKTNRLASGKVQELVSIYRGQVEAYQRALKEFFGKPVRGILYSTTLGEWVEVT